MLPSMPLLMTPIKELNDDSSDTSDDSPQSCRIAESNYIFTTNSAGVPSQDGKTIPCLNCTTDFNSESDTSKATDTLYTPEKRISSEPTSAQKKKKKTQHKKTLSALTPESDTDLETSGQCFAEAYFQKVKSTVNDITWNEFIQELVAFEGKTDKQPTELYKRMEQLLSPHTELVDEFLAFLLPHQALQINRLMPYLLLVSMKELFRKMNILLMKKQVRQIFSALESLSHKDCVSLADVKDTVLPLLKSSPLLTNHFLSLLPGERPPESLMTDFEQIDLKDDSLFETIIVPDCPDPYGNENCICSCHSNQKNKHCVSCGIKYVNGRVYLQHGKALRPAKVTFKGTKHLDLLKWEEGSCRARKRHLSKTMSPNCLDHRNNPDSEDDCGFKKSPRTPRIKVSRTKVSRKEMIESKDYGVLDGIFPLIETKQIADKTIEGNEAKHDLNDDHEFDDMVMDKQDGIDDHEFDDMVMDKHDGIEDQDFDDVALDNECNTEEDEEEEDLNRIHSENESSLEAEDMIKEVESGNDYSFEEEEIEDLTNHAISPKSTEVHVECEGESAYCSIRSFKNCEEEKALQSKKSFENTVDKFKLFSIIQDVKQEKHTFQLVQNIKLEPESKSQFESYSKEIEKGKKAIKVETEQIEKNYNQEQIMEKEHLIISKIKTETEVSESVSDGFNERNSSCEVESSSQKRDGDNSSKEWTREEDKIILQTFQHESGLEQTFETASLHLPNRSKEEIQERFEVLLRLLKEMISDEPHSNI